MTREEPLKGMRILIVEDDYYLASDEQEILRAAGAEVIGPFGRADEANRAVAGQTTGQPIDCALVDINLGAGPCFQVAEKLRDEGIPFLFTTGYDAAAIPEEFAHIVRVEKPVAQRTLLTALTNLGGRGLA